MYCKNCGNQLPDTAKFCSKCGTPVQVLGAAVKGPESESKETAVKLKKAPKERRKRHLTIIMILVALALAAVVAVGVYYLRSDEDDAVKSEIASGMESPSENADEISSVASDTEALIQAETETEILPETNDADIGSMQETDDNNEAAKDESEDQLVLIRNTRYDSNGDITTDIAYEYNQFGKRIQMSEYHWSEFGTTSGYTEYEYDVDGERIAARKYDDTGELKQEKQYKNGEVIKSTNYVDGYVDSYMEYERDDEGNTKRILQFDGNGTLEWYEDEEEVGGKKASFVLGTRYNSDGSVEWCEEAVCDADGYVTSYTRYNADGEAEEVWQIEYDSERRVSKTTNYSELYGTYYERNMTYNDMDDYMEVTYYCDFGNGSTPAYDDYRYENEYDDEGNLIKEVTYLNGEYNSTEVWEYVWLSSLFSEESEDDYSELAQYMGGNLDEFVTMIGDMQNDGATAGVQYSNDEITVASHADPNVICYLKIHGDCKYQIKGIQYGMPFSEAASVAYAECTSVADDLETYKCYWLDDKTTLGIYADEDLLVESVYLLVAN